MFLVMLTRVTGDGHCQAGASDKYSATPSDLVKVCHRCRIPMIQSTNIWTQTILSESSLLWDAGPCDPLLPDLWAWQRRPWQVGCPVPNSLYFFLWSLAWIPCCEIGRDTSLAPHNGTRLVHGMIWIFRWICQAFYHWVLMNPASADFPGAGKLAKTSPRRPQWRSLEIKKCGVWNCSWNLTVTCRCLLRCL